MAISMRLGASVIRQLVLDLNHQQAYPFTTKVANLVIANDGERVDMYTKLILIAVVNHREWLTPPTFLLASQRGHSPSIMALLEK